MSSFFAPRHAVVATVLVVLACSSSQEEPPAVTPPPAPPPVTTASPPEDAGAKGPSDVTVTFVDRWGLSTGTPVNVPQAQADRPTKATVLVGSVEEPTQTIEGTYRPDGTLVFAGVPKGPYTLDLETDRGADSPKLRYRYAMPDEVRTIRFGNDFWPRNDATKMTDTTSLGLTVSVPATLTAKDRLEWLSVRSNFYRTTEVVTGTQDGDNPPDADATSTTDWTLAADMLDGAGEGDGLPSTGDDLVLLQTRPSVVKRDGDRFDPWNNFTRTDVVGVLEASSPSFAAGKTNTVTGTLAAPTTASTTITFSGSSFGVLQNSGDLDRASAIARVALYHENGAGPGYPIGLTPESWRFSAVSRPKTDFPQCYSDTYRCVQASCPVSCLGGGASSGLIHPGDVAYTFSAARAVNRRPVLDAIYRFSRIVPVVGSTAVVVSAEATTFRPQVGASTALALELGPVRSLDVVTKNDAPLESNTDGVRSTKADAALRIKFQPPSLGTPEYYDVQVLQARFGDDVDQRYAARIFTRETTVPIPTGALRAGGIYYVKVYAVRDGRSWAEPDASRSDTSLRTSAVSTVFVAE